LHKTATRQLSIKRFAQAVNDVDFSLQVKGLEFNGFSPNLLASGAAGGELCIWDVAAPAQPSLYPALKVCRTPQQQPQLGSNNRHSCAAMERQQQQQEASKQQGLPCAATTGTGGRAKPQPLQRQQLVAVLLLYTCTFMCCVTQTSIDVLPDDC
jgi:hypothetical protein